MNQKKAVRPDRAAKLVRFTPDELNLVREAAARRGVSMNTFIRRTSTRAASVVLQAAEDVLDPLPLEAPDAA